MASICSVCRRPDGVSSNNRFTRTATQACSRRPPGTAPSVGAHGAAGSKNLTGTPAATAGMAGVSSWANCAEGTELGVTVAAAVGASTGVDGGPVVAPPSPSRSGVAVAPPVPPGTEGVAEPAAAACPGNFGTWSLLMGPAR